MYRKRARRFWESAYDFDSQFGFHLFASAVKRPRFAISTIKRRVWNTQTSAEWQAEKENRQDDTGRALQLQSAFDLRILR